MSAATTIPAVLRALEARWRAAFTAAEVDVTVVHGSASTERTARDRILVIGSAVTKTQVPSTFGDVFDDLHDDETYVITCGVEVSYPGAAGSGGQLAAVEEALRLYELCRQAVTVPDESLGVAGVQYARIGGTERLVHGVQPETIAKARNAAYEFQVTVLGVL